MNVARMAAKEALLRKRNALLALKDANQSYEHQLDLDREPDWVDDAANAEDRVVAHGLTDAESREIRAIDAALERIAQGRFGVCASCGEDIEPERLQAMPETALCLGCQLGAERV
jgi:DnaK suppressor protein